MEVNIYQTWNNNQPLNIHIRVSLPHLNRLLHFLDPTVFDGNIKVFVNP
ncbi:MAG: hypothetical protein JRJ03_11345 [Deltaproteobacteria bacterium]|nr:hypothetical protein [Deltaproteobacteria bacterium]